MTFREIIESCWRSSEWSIGQKATLLYWLSQEDPVQLCFDFSCPEVCEVDISGCPFLIETILRERPVDGAGNALSAAF